jgi:hypothetical protein
MRREESLHEPLPDLPKGFRLRSVAFPSANRSSPQIGKPILRCNRQCLLEWRKLVLWSAAEKSLPEEQSRRQSAARIAKDSTR